METANDKKLPKIFFKMKEQLIQQLAINMIVESLSDDCETAIRLPDSWVENANHLKDQMLSDIEVEAKKESDPWATESVSRPKK